AAFELLDPESPTYALDIVSIIESILDDPRPILQAQLNKARAEAIAEMKAEGIEYEERMERLAEITYPMPLEDLLFSAYETYRRGHPWVGDYTVSPKSIVRDMYERAMNFSEYVQYYELARAEGTVLRYLADAYRTLDRTVPEHYKTDDLQDLIEWLGEMVRQVDSSLIDEWEKLQNPDEALEESEEIEEKPKPVTANQRAFRVLVRNAMFRLVELAALEKEEELAELAPDIDWTAALDAYYEEHDEILTGPDARGPNLLIIDTDEPGVWRVRQIIDDPEGNHDWGISAEV